MDAIDTIGGDELRETLRELRVINRRLGGYATSTRALDDLARRVRLEPGRQVSVLDVGGGSGDAVPTILAWGRRRGFDVHVTVADLHPETVAEATRQLRDLPDATATRADLFAIEARSYDVVHAALFLHHFDGDDAARALAAMGRIARVGVVVNDLHRHPVPWLLIRLITGAVSRNRLIRADAPLSVARAFTAADWRRLAGETALDLRWRRVWAWRWAVSGLPTAEGAA